MACAGKLIILNGSPHSGHDLIAAELAWLTPEVFYALGADMLHRKVLGGPTDAPVLEIILSASARNGSSIAADFCGPAEPLLQLTQGLDVTWVEVRCDPALRARREQERGARALGPASQDCPSGPADLTVDGADPRLAAQQVLAYLQQRPMIREPLARFALPSVPLPSASRPGTVVMLCGTSSAGKSTLQRALQKRRPFLAYGLDAAFQALPLRYMGLPVNAREIAEGIDRKEGWMGATNIPMPSGDGPRTWQQIGPVLRQSASSMYATIAELARLGNDVVSDQVLYYRDWYEEAQHRMAGLKVVCVSIEADPAALQQHEQQRGDRVQGVSLGLLDQMFKDVPYAVHVHSGRSTPEEEAERVLRELPPL